MKPDKKPVSKKTTKSTPAKARKIPEKKSKVETKPEAKVTAKAPKAEKKSQTVIDKSKFAVIRISGTQLKVYQGAFYEVTKIDGSKGDKIEVNDVLLVANGDDVKVGNPVVQGAKVSLRIASQKKDKKIDVFKYKAKARYRRRFGMRPRVTRIEVVGIKI